MISLFEVHYRQDSADTQKTWVLAENVTTATDFIAQQPDTRVVLVLEHPVPGGQVWVIIDGTGTEVPTVRSFRVMTEVDFPHGLRCAMCHRPIRDGQPYRAIPFTDDTDMLICVYCGPDNQEDTDG